MDYKQIMFWQINSNGDYLGSDSEIESSDFEIESSDEEEKETEDEIKKQDLILVPAKTYFSDIKTKQEIKEKNHYITRIEFEREKQRIKEINNLLEFNIKNKNQYKISHEIIGKLFNYSSLDNYRELRDSIKNSGLDYKERKENNKIILYFNLINLIKFRDDDDLLKKIYYNNYYSDEESDEEIKEEIHEKEIKKERRRCVICYLNKIRKDTKIYCKICKKYICDDCFIKNHN